MSKTSSLYGVISCVVVAAAPLLGGCSAGGDWSAEGETVGSAEQALASDLLIDDFSSESQYNDLHVNDLGGQTSDFNTMLSATVTSDLALKLVSDGYNDYWQSFLSANGCATIDSAATLSFKVKGLIGGETFGVGLVDGGANCMSPNLLGASLSNYVNVTTSYQTVRIPVRHISTSITQLQNVIFFMPDGSSQTVFIDDLKLEASSANRLYALDGASLGTKSLLSYSPGSAAATDTIPSADNFDGGGEPTKPLVYEVKGLNGTYDPSKSTELSLYLNAGNTVGLAPQARVSYDVDGDGVYDKIELYNYFATDPIASTWEHYTQAQGLQWETGHLSNMQNGTVRLEVWNRFRNGTAEIRTSASVANGQQSSLVIPFNP